MIRTFSSVDTQATIRGTVPDVASRGGVPAQAGANRFVWDMRYPAARVIPGTTLHGRPEGPLAPPGSYQLRLEIDAWKRRLDEVRSKECKPFGATP